MSRKKEWKQRKINLGSAIVAAAVMLVAGFGIGNYWSSIKGTFLPYLGIGDAERKTSMDWSSLNEVYSEISSDFDGDIDKDAVVEGAKVGLVAALGDKYTSYMPAKEASDFQKSLHGEVGSGIGVVMGERDNYVRIIRTLPDNPARKAGLLSGDIIYKIDGEEVYSQDADVIAEKVRGEAGSTVSLTIIRDKEEKTFKLTREEINNVSAEVTYPNSDTALILTTRFDTDTGTIIENFAKEFKDKGIKKVILDLRDNGGGYVSAAQDLVSLWIDGDTVCTQKSKDSEHASYASHGKDILKDMKTIVLVNSNTASASEIVAGALQDYKKATILGTKTFGKGVVQSLKNLSNGSLLKVTSAHWYTPNGNSIDKTGIKPDKEVDRTYDDINAGRDPQLDEAMKI